MTADEIRAAVQGSPQLKRLAAAGNIVALTQMLRVAGQRVQAGEMVTDRDAADRFPSIDGLPGALAFEAALAALEKFAVDNASGQVLARRLRARSITRLLDRFTTTGLDFGHPDMRAVLDMLAVDVLTPAQVAAFKGLARVVPAELTERDVREALGTVLPAVPSILPTWGPAIP